MHLKDPSLLRSDAFIDGAWCAADDGATVDIRNPADDSIVGTVPVMRGGETRRAIEAAARALPEWSKRTAKERGASLMLITHDLGVVAETANRIAVMYAGQIVEYGPAAAVLRGPASPYARDLVQSIPSFSRRGKQLTAIAGNVPSPAEFPSGCRFHPRCQYAIKECAEAVPALIELGEGRGVRCIRSADIDALAASAAREQGAK